MDGDDGGTTMCLMPLNCTLKNVQNGKFNVYFSTIKKKEEDVTSVHLSIICRGLSGPRMEVAT